METARARYINKSRRIVRLSERPIRLGIEGYPTPRFAPNGYKTPLLFSIRRRITTIAIEGRRNNNTRRFTFTIFPKLPLKISQNSCQRFVGRVLLAYSSLFSFPSSNLVIKPFFCSAIISPTARFTPIKKYLPQKNAKPFLCAAPKRFFPKKSSSRAFSL